MNKKVLSILAAGALTAALFSGAAAYADDTITIWCPEEITSFTQEKVAEVQEANPDYAEILAETEAKWDASQAYTAVKDMMTAHPEANTVVCSADGMGIGAVQALADLGLTAKVGEEGHITFVCIDGDPNGCKSVEEGIIDQEAEHNAALHSDIAFKVIVDYLHGYEVPATILFETTARNIDNISEAWGNLDVSDVANWPWTEQDIYVLQTPYAE